MNTPGLAPSRFALLGLVMLLMASLLLYLSMPVARGLALLLICLLPVTGMFNLLPKQAMFLSMMAAAALMLSAASLWRLEPTTFLWREDGIAAMMVAMMAMAIGWVSHRLIDRMQSQHTQQEALRKTLESMQQQATKDLTTGLPNQAYMREWMTQSAKRAHRSGQPLTIAVMARDQALPAATSSANDADMGVVTDELVFEQWISSASRVFRENDVTARWSHDELLVLFEGSPPDMAGEGLARLRQETRGVLFSSGVKAWSPGMPLDEAVAQAQAALQRARQAGGQRDEFA